MKEKKYLYRLGSINYQPNEKFLYITVNNEWLLVRQRGAKGITQKKYDEMHKNGMPNIFERIEL